MEVNDLIQSTWTLAERNGRGQGRERQNGEREGRQREREGRKREGEGRKREREDREREDREREGGGESPEKWQPAVSEKRAMYMLEMESPEKWQPAISEKRAMYMLEMEALQSQTGSNSIYAKIDENGPPSADQDP